MAGSHRVTVAQTPVGTRTRAPIHSWPEVCHSSSSDVHPSFPAFFFASLSCFASHTISPLPGARSRARTSSRSSASRLITSIAFSSTYSMFTSPPSAGIGASTPRYHLSSAGYRYSTRIADAVGASQSRASNVGFDAAAFGFGFGAAAAFGDGFGAAAAFGDAFGFGFAAGGSIGDAAADADLVFSDPPAVAGDGACSGAVFDGPAPRAGTGLVSDVSAGAGLKNARIDMASA